MAKQTKELTTKQKIRKNKLLQLACKIGEYAVIPVPFAALMIANKDVWFNSVQNGLCIGIGGTATIALLVAAILLVVRESEDKKVANGFPLIMIKWLMACIIITLVEQVLHTIAGVMWIATSGLAASFGIDITRNHLKKKGNEQQLVLDTANRELETAKAKQEILREQEEVRKIKVKIKK